MNDYYQKLVRLGFHPDEEYKEDYDFQSAIEVVKEQLYDKNLNIISENLLDEYIGYNGPSEFLLGELGRAWLKICYRYFNDGDTYETTIEDPEHVVQLAFKFIESYSNIIEHSKVSWEIIDQIEDLVSKMLEFKTLYKYDYKTCNTYAALLYFIIRLGKDLGSEEANNYNYLDFDTYQRFYED